MSRHILTPKNPLHVVIVGWDPPLQTFFVQVIDGSKDEENRMVLWKGTSMRELYEVGQLRRQVSRYAEFSPEIAGILYGDKDEGR